MLKRLLTQLQLGPRSALANALLVGNTFVWYFAVLSLLLITMVNNIDPSISQTALVWSMHFGALIISAIAGTFISKRIVHKKFIILWLGLGVLSSFAAATINASDINQVSLIGLLFGISLGLGMPACISRYTDSVPIEKRGRMSGITLFISGVGFIVLSIFNLSFLILGVVLAIWRLMGLGVYFYSKVPFQNMTTRIPSQYKKILSQHTFLLYFLPWVMFSLINYLIVPIAPNISESDQSSLNLVQTGFMGLFALFGGFFIDSMGRKRIAVAGFTLLGIGTAILGISSSELTILYFNAILDGVAMGFLLVLFIFTVWGELNSTVSSDKYYALGVMPFFVSKFLALTVGRSLTDSLQLTPNTSAALFSFGAVFLFIAVLPLMYAPETLPEKTMKDRDLNSYIKKAKMIVEKEAAKNQTQQPKKEKKEDFESIGEAQESLADKKARELAEKYY